MTVYPNMASFYLCLLSIVFLAGTLGTTLRWLVFVEDMLVHHNYTPFLHPQSTSSKQYTYFRTYTEYAAPTTLIADVTQTYSFTGPSTSFSETTRFGTITYKVSSGASYGEFPTNGIDTSGITPSLATVVGPTCLDGPCTKRPVASTRTLSGATATAMATAAPTATAAAMATEISSAEAHASLLHDTGLDQWSTLRSKVQGATAAIWMMLISVLGNIATALIWLVAMAKLKRRRSYDGDDKRTVTHTHAAFRWVPYLYAVLTASTFATGLASIILLGPPSRYGSAFETVGVVFWSLAMATCVATLISHLVSAARRGRRDDAGHQSSESIRESRSALV